MSDGNDIEQHAVDINKVHGVGDPVQGDSIFMDAARK